MLTGERELDHHEYLSTPEGQAYLRSDTEWLAEAHRRGLAAEAEKLATREPNISAFGPVWHLDHY